MKRKLTVGITNVSLAVFVYDTTSTTGAGLAGLTHTSPGILIEYRRQGSGTWVQLGVGTGLVAGTLGTYVSGGIVADGGLAGAYEIGIPDAAFAAGARFVTIRFRGAANMFCPPIEIELDAINYQDPTRAGLLALPNANASAVGGLITRGNGAGQLQPSSGNVSVNGDAFGNSLFIPNLAAKADLPVLHGGVAQDGDLNFIQLDLQASTTNNYYSGATILITSGLGAGQYRTIGSYNGASKVAGISPNWVDPPDDSSSYVIIPPVTGGAGGGSGDASQATLLEVKAKTDLINAGSVFYSGPVDANGNLRSPIIIGDDYLAANSRAFKWTIPAIPGIVPATAVSRFAGRHALGLPYTWNVTGTVTDIGGGFWELSHDMTRTVSGALIPAGYDWSVELTAAGGTEITPIRSGKNATAAAKFS